MPEARGLPIFGTIFSLAASGWAGRLHEYVDERHKELGPVFRDRIGPVRAVFVNSPKEFLRIYRLEGPTPRHFLPEAWVLYNDVRRLRRGLLFMDGEEWLHFRKILNKLMLRTSPMSYMVDPCEEAAKGLASRWRLYADNEKSVPELNAELYHWSIEAMLATLLGPLWHQEGAYVMKEAGNLPKCLHKIFEYSAQLSLLPAQLAMRLRLPAWRKFVNAADEALGIVRALVPIMARHNAEGGLLKMMMDEGIRGDDLVRIVADLVLAAGDTTAYSMQWALFLLGSHPEIQERLYGRIKGLKGERLLQDSFLKGVLKETLRLYPTAPFLTRYLAEDNFIGGYSVSKEDLILMSLYSSGRDSSNFVEPDAFHPERWIRTEKGNYDYMPNPHASLPFALGVRSCVGRKLAQTQMMLAIAKLVETFRITCTNQDRVRMILHLISVPSEPIQLSLTRR
ncbi:cytochrome P450 315a1, mitochondrial [Orussus abietinus]|uniref:cytochrome P450 315a1, mitochondrial n=1 Tax=Orussus abietinus TaxID=222816 RepID=UPI000C715A80|nr:cytochrome P450 315a1, mitochondrial [Orussus abietinus]